MLELLWELESKVTNASMSKTQHTIAIPEQPQHSSGQVIAHEGTSVYTYSRVRWCIQGHKHERSLVSILP
jgi:hypothetical protein